MPAGSSSTAYCNGRLEPRTVTRYSSKTQPSKLGLALRPLTEEERKQIEAEGGLLVEQSEGPAARAGVQAGDVVLSFDGRVRRAGVALGFALLPRHGDDATD